MKTGAMILVIARVVSDIFFSPIPFSHSFSVYDIAPTESKNSRVPRVICYRTVRRRKHGSRRASKSEINVSRYYVSRKNVARGRRPEPKTTARITRLIYGYAWESPDAFFSEPPAEPTNHAEWLESSWKSATRTRHGESPGKPHVCSTWGRFSGKPTIRSLWGE